MEKKSNVFKILLFTLILCFAGLLIYYAASYSRANYTGFGIYDIENFLLSYGKWSILLLMLIYLIKPLFVVTPISILAVASGLLYGPIQGTVYTLLGAFLSATVGFYISRFLGRDFVNKILRGKSTNIEGDIEKHGFHIMLFLRLAFIFPYDPLSYAAGMSKMKYRHFIFGTIIGVTPEMFAYNYLGTSINDLFSKKSLIAVLIIAAFAGGSAYFRYKKKKI